MDKCEKHGTPYRYEQGERGKTLQICDDCEKDSRAAMDELATKLPPLERQLNALVSPAGQSRDDESGAPSEVSIHIPNWNDLDLKTQCALVRLVAHCLDAIESR